MALSMLDIPLPEDDDMSDDEFDGYIDPLDDALGNDDEDMDSEGDVPPNSRLPAANWSICRHD